MRYILLLLAAFALTGCASGDYLQYAKTQEAIEVAKSNAQVARYQALGQIANGSDSTAKVAAVMALAMGASQGDQGRTNIAAPEPNQALQWASVLVPGLTQVYGIRSNAQVAMRQSDNSASTAIATTNGFVGIAAKIQSNTTSTLTNNTTTTSGNSGANSGNSTATPTVVNQPAPLVVTQPTPLVVDTKVVNQPAPIVVTPTVLTTPNPLIVNPTVITTPPPVVITTPGTVTSGVGTTTGTVTTNTTSTGTTTTTR